jgi:hypothetical protein
MGKNDSRGSATPIVFVDNARPLATIPRKGAASVLPLQVVG